jgi:hypothetical protein
VTQPPPDGDLLGALAHLRAVARRVRLPLEVGDAGAARAERDGLVAQLDDYVLPRLERIDAPLLAVVGGSTGAGKSTLVNSLIGRTVSVAGVLRPTTRSPVLVHHREDADWFAESHILPGLARTTATDPARAAGDPRSVQLVATDQLNPGLALLDAPDIDSVVTANRELARQLLAAADLWIFVTTAARYADAVPWDLLRAASVRSAAVAVVLDRTAPAADEEVRAHLAQLLRQEGLGTSPLLVVPEVELHDGLLPETAIAPVRTWLHELAADAEIRARVVRRTLDGVVSSYPDRVAHLATAVAAQRAALGALRGAVTQAYDDATAAVDESLRDGSLLRGEVLARWQEFIGTGELLRTLETRVGRWRDRMVSAVRGQPAPGEQLSVALESGVEALVRAEADAAAERVATEWRAIPGGSRLLAASAEAGTLTRSSPGLDERLRRAVRDWQGGVLDLVRTEGATKRSSARFLSYGINGSGLLVMIAVFAHTGGLTGTEVVVAGGTSALAQKVLEALLGDQAVRDLAAKARADLRVRVDALLVEEQERYTALLADADQDAATAEELRAAVRAVEGAR